MQGSEGQVMSSLLGRNIHKCNLLTQLLSLLWSLALFFLSSHHCSLLYHQVCTNIFWCSKNTRTFADLLSLNSDKSCCCLPQLLLCLTVVFKRHNCLKFHVPTESQLKGTTVGQKLLFVPLLLPLVSLTHFLSVSLQNLATDSMKSWFSTFFLHSSCWHWF